MTIIISNITTTIDMGKDSAVPIALAKLNISSNYIKSTCLVKSSVDARRKPAKFVCSVAVELDDDGYALIKDRKDITFTVKKEDKISFPLGTSPLLTRPVVVGFGPAGMFAALLLSRNGYRPIVLERGEDIDSRLACVDEFWSSGKLNAKSNVQFGEGGAGAFSDGKLTTRINDPLCRYVLNELVSFGAPNEILTLAKPHVGTDILKDIVKNIRMEIIKNGGEVHFNSTVTDFKIKNGKLASVTALGDNIPTQTAIVAIGHSARDTFHVLERCGLSLVPKAFSVGMRIEHLQSEIDRALYGDLAGHPNLPIGEYQLSHREPDRTAYTFCMCPGGMVVAATSENGQVVTNGMSYHSRGLNNANSAYVASVSSKDFGDRWQDAVLFQETLEHKAFVAGGGDYKAPFCYLGDMTGKKYNSSVTPSYPIGVKEYPVWDLLPKEVSEILKRTLPIMGRKLFAFDSPNAVLTGLETRTSSPVRVLRGENFSATGIDGIFPSGEGAGYAGGIMSAAVDGIKCAAAIMEKWSVSTDRL